MERVRVSFPEEGPSSSKWAPQEPTRKSRAPLRELSGPSMLQDPLLCTAGPYGLQEPYLGL